MQNHRKEGTGKLPRRWDSLPRRNSRRGKFFLAYLPRFVPRLLRSALLRLGFSERFIPEVELNVSLRKR